MIASLAKALEVTCNDILTRVGGSLPPEVGRVRVEDREIELGRRHLTLGQFTRAVGGERNLNRALAQRLEYGGWFTGSLPAIIDDLLRVRNPGVHETRVDRETATRLRNQFAGLGCQGVFQELARVRPKLP